MKDYLDHLLSIPKFNFLVVIIGLFVLITATGCPPRSGSQPSAPSIEFFQFKYKIALRQPDGKYRVPWRANDGSCNGHMDLPEAQIVNWVQTENSSMHDCSDAYIVEVDNNRRIQTPAGVVSIVSVEVHGDPTTSQSDLQIRAGRAIVPGTFSEPTNIFIEGIGPIVPGMLSGFTEVNFGVAGPIFSSDRGNKTFFEHDLDSINMSNKRVSGTFRFLASNMNSTTDNRLLIAMDGVYLMDID